MAHSEQSAGGFVALVTVSLRWLHLRRPPLPRPTTTTEVLPRDDTSASDVGRMRTSLLVEGLQEVSGLPSADHGATATTSSTCFIATNFGEGGPDFNQPMHEALGWLLAGGFRAEVPTIGKFGSTAGRPIGMQTADGKVGFRVEFDARNGAHINVVAGKERGPHFTFAASEATVERIQKLFGRC